MLGKCSSALAVTGMLAFGLTLYSEAAFAASRAATMQKCNNLAQSKVRSSERNADRNRTAIYKSCMTRAGHRP